MAELSFEYLKRVLKADFENGKLYWLPRSVDLFPSGGNAEAACKRWNSRDAGTEAFTTMMPNGYLKGKLSGHHLYAHRVIWALHIGSLPTNHIDHANGDRSDNRIENLREATRSENQRNRKIPANNSSGALGVSWNKRMGKWQASIWNGHRLEYLGCRSELDDAKELRLAAEVRLGYHQNHGRA